MHEIESSFGKDRARKLEARRRRQNRFRLMMAIAGACVLVAAVSIGIWLDRPPVTDDADAELVQQQVEEVAIPVYVPVIIDLPGDPVHIELGGDGSGERPRLVPAPPALLAQGITGSISILSGNVVESGERLAIALPSTQQDFAFFQSQRSTVPAAAPATSDPAMATPDTPGAASQGTEPSTGPVTGDQTAQATADANSPLDDGGDWGAIDSAGIEGSEENFEKTEVADNTTTFLLTPERLRAPVTEELIVRVVAEVENERFFIENGINLLDAKRAAISFQSEFGTAKLDAGSLIAMRLLRTGGQGSDRKLVQVAIYLTDQFLGALALSPDNVLQAAADPWANKQLLTKAEQTAKPVEAVRYRLLDSIFSAGLRKGVPASIVGEAIMYLSRQHDLGDLAEPDDKMTIVYSDKPRPGGQSPGRVLYVGVVHQGKTIRCFVYKPDSANDFKCVDENDITAEIEVSNGIVIPVAGGVLTSGFGPRKHPILKTVLLHKGVDWAAPIGTPVLAAMNGTISFAGDGGTYGNLIKIAHESGRESRYAHLNAFAKDLKPGATVTAGDVIGYIGTTGRSTGPHLHFELYLSGQPIDPLVTATSVVAAAGGDEGAVEKLVNRIIHVESGGNATAKNPLSTATGLGQFIESTWLRMMRTYRADLANSLSREKLLALRFDPTLSREMVTNLARENRAYLVAGGVQITAGRLYLAHFLGPEGARSALSASDSSDLEQLLGSGVINANPFLRGKDVLFIKNWAEKKMQGKAYVPQVAKAEVKKESVQKTSPAYALYRKTLSEVAG